MLYIKKETGKQLYYQIYEYYRDNILSGQIAEHTPLPSTRQLAEELSVSRTTVDTAYQQLLAEGYIYSVPKSGYYVSHVARIKPAAAAPSFHAKNDIAEEDLIHIEGIRYNFQYGRLSADTFPYKLWKKLTNKVLLEMDPVHITAYNSRTGEAAFKEEIAKYIYASRNVSCDADHIVIGSSLLTIISLICQLFQGEAKNVAIEDPCYDTVRHFFINHGYDICPISLTDDGLNVERLAGIKTKLVYITPSHQFPTGKVMSVNQRIHLLQWAEENDAFIIEDDYDSEYRYDSKPLPSLQSLDSANRVIYTNTFSKSLAPALRTSFMTLPPQLKTRYDAKFANYNCTVPLLTQLTLAQFMAEGHWTRHLRKIALMNKKKHNHLVRQIAEQLGAFANIHGNNAGLHLLLSVHNGMEEPALIAAAKTKGVMVYPVSHYYAAPPAKTNCVLLGFGGLSLDEITEGVRLLREAWG